MTKTADDFENHYQQWKSFCQTDVVQLMSSDDAYLDNPYFEAMVNMGEAAVPYIIAKLESDEGAHFLIHALARITNKTFTQEEVEAAQIRYGKPLGNQGYARLWIDWWKRRKEQ